MFKSVGITFGTRVLAALINFGMVVLLSRVLGPEGKGQCSLYLVIFSTALIICECISGSTVVYLLSKFSYRQLLLVFYIWSLPCSILIGAFFYIFGKIDIHECLLVVLLNWLNAAVSMNQLVVLGKKRLVLYNLLNILQPVLTIAAVLICFTYWKAAPATYLAALSIAWGITFVAGLSAVSRFDDDKGRTSWIELIRYGFKTGVANQAGTLMQLVNTRIGYLLLPAAELGIFSNAISLCEAALLINSSIGTVQYSRMVNETKRPEQIKLTHLCFWSSACLMMLVLILLVLIPAPVFSWLFGDQFSRVKQPILLLAPGIFLYSGYIIFSYFFSGTGRFYVNNFPALAAILSTILGYTAAIISGIAISIPVVSVILVLSYSGLFTLSLVLFLKMEKITLKQWFKLPAWQSFRELI